MKLRFRDLDSGPNRDHHLAITRLRAGETTYLHQHDFPEVFLVMSGSGWHRCNGSMVRIGVGDLLWVSPKDRHCYHCGAEEQLEFANLALAPRWWHHFSRLWSDSAGLIELLRGKSKQPRKVRLGPHAEQAFRELIDRGAAERADIISTVLQLVRGTTERIQREEETPIPEWLVSWRNEVTNSHTMDRSLAYWQRRSGRSPEHLARSCRIFFGLTPTEVVLRNRIARAKGLLLRPDAKVASVAFEAGFQNLGYFYRVFRRIVGQTPRTWMKVHEGASIAVPRRQSR
jgi:AraC family cel operon transcriptional repressor